MVAENDAALGRVVEAISRSAIWKESAIFVLEDDAQNGPDHVDAHRSPALVISPFVRRRIVDSTLYSTSSVLRTMELILGLEPMTQYDASATPLYNAFQPTPTPAPYTAVGPRVSIDEKNGSTAWGAQASLQDEPGRCRHGAGDRIERNPVAFDPRGRFPDAATQAGRLHPALGTRTGEVGRALDRTGRRPDIPFADYGRQP